MSGAASEGRRTRRTVGPAPTAGRRRRQPGLDDELRVEPVPPERPRVATERQRQIYLEASRLFVAKGYDATSMSDIARAVNITKAGLYHFVKGKEDLLFTIMNFGMDEIFDEVVRPALEVTDPLDRLRLILRNHLTNIGRVSSKNGNPVTIVSDEAGGLSPANRRIIEGRKRTYFELVRSTVQELKDRGHVDKDLDPTVAAHNVIGMILWMARWRRPGGRLTLEQIIEQITRQALNSLRADGT